MNAHPTFIVADESHLLVVDADQTFQTAARSTRTAVVYATQSISTYLDAFGAQAEPKVIHTKRPEAWSSLSDTDAALLDFLRRGGETSELSPEETIRRTLALLSEPGRYRRLLKIADTDPPRLRAMLGALGQTLAKPLRHDRPCEGIPQPVLTVRLWRVRRTPQRPLMAGQGAPPVKLFEHPDFEQAILRAEEHFRARDLRPAIIEKDYYVTEVLRVLADTAGDKIIFKGGTSLSKGWNLIQRFSEDINLFLDPITFKPSLGKQGIDRELKRLRDAIGKHPALTFVRDESRRRHRDGPC